MKLLSAELLEKLPWPLKRQAKNREIGNREKKNINERMAKNINEKKQRKMRFEPVMAKDENGPKHGTLSDPIDGPEEPGIEEDGGGDQCRDDG